MAEMQLDIFGGETPVEELGEKPPRETIKSAFRRMYGYDESHRCGECKHLVLKWENRRWYKCELMGVSSSEATDIRLKDPACKRWEPVDDR